MTAGSPSAKSMDSLQVALRTYTLSLSLSLFPAIFPILSSSKARSSERIREILRRELSPSGFAFAMTLAIAGGRAVDQLWKTLVPPQADKVVDSNAKRGWRQMSASQRTFLANTMSSSIAVMLLTLRRRRNHIPTASIPLTVPVPPPQGSPTLDLTLLLLVRALDAQVQSFFRHSITRNMDNHGSRQITEAKRIIQRASTDLDAFVFWLACSRIMWCFFYQPERLPRSYVKWITALADMDSRLLLALRAIREGSWQYGHPSTTHSTLLTSMASDLKLNTLLGDPSHVPGHGGAGINKTWTALNYRGRRGVGGIPCELVHYNISGNSCTGNAILRAVKAFGQALLIYAPVHVLPAALFNPAQVITNPLPIISSLIRSASFLSTFVSSIWFTVCFVRTLFVARLFPQIPHNFLDGPQGGILAGCLVCGASIGIERGQRRGEIALYVLPRAIRACLPYKWIKSGSWRTRTAERLVFVMSLASILTTAIHQPDALRGVSQWTVAYIMSGTSAGFWKRRRQSHSQHIGDSPPHPEMTLNMSLEGR